MTCRYLLLLLLLVTFTTCKVVKYETIYRPISPEDLVKKPKRVILMIGDGMGIAQITTAMYSNKNRTNLEEFPVIGLQKCDSADALATDSAAAATAMACGVKTFNQALGVDIDSIPRTSILIEAEQKGLATGIVTTSSIVHATPAGFYAHQTQRYQYENIAAQFVESNIDLAIGGGKKYFDRRSQDDRNLSEELSNKGYMVQDFLSTELRSLSIDPRKNLLFFTADSEPLPASQGRDYLPKATQLATRYLSEKKTGNFFLLIEGAQIDWAGHARNGEELITEIKDFERAIKKMLDFAREDQETLLLVTADHETGGLTIAPTATKDNVLPEFATNAHTAQMVPVFAYGPGSSYFAGVYDNTEIYKKLRIVLGFE